jgi:hypothetical protein
LHLSPGGSVRDVPDRARIGHGPRSTVVCPAGPRKIARNDRSVIEQRRDLCDARLTAAQRCYLVTAT